MTVSIRVTAAVKTQRECKAVAGCSGLELPKAQGEARLEYRVAQSSEGSCWGIEAALWGIGPSYRAEPGLSTDPQHRVQERARKDAGPSNRSFSSWVCLRRRQPTSKRARALGFLTRRPWVAKELTGPEQQRPILAGFEPWPCENGKGAESQRNAQPCPLLQDAGGNLHRDLAGCFLNTFTKEKYYF